MQPITVTIPGEGTARITPQADGGLFVEVFSDLLGHRQQAIQPANTRLVCEAFRKLAEQQGPPRTAGPVESFEASGRTNCRCCGRPDRPTPPAGL